MPYFLKAGGGRVIRVVLYMEKNAGIVKGASDPTRAKSRRGRCSLSFEHEFVGSLEKWVEYIRVISSSKEAMVEGLEVFLYVCFFRT